jgi:hypothetical protein
MEHKRMAKGMTPTDAELLADLERVASRHHDGHVTIMRFTTNWRVGFGTPLWRCDICDMASGKTFADAALAALANPTRDICAGTECSCGIIVRRPDLYKKISRRPAKTGAKRSADSRN